LTVIREEHPECVVLYQSHQTNLPDAHHLLSMIFIPT
jgi:hypothetical protein